MANTDRNILPQIDGITVAPPHHGDPDACNGCKAVIKNSSASLKLLSQNIRSIYKNLDSFQAQLGTR